MVYETNTVMAYCMQWWSFIPCSRFYSFCGGKPQERPRLNNRELARIFAAIGAKHGYDSIKAEFAAFNDFKVKWTRSFKWAEFEVSDYLMDAPEDVVWALADTIFKKIGGEDAVYPDVLCGWLTSDDFVNRKQPLYIERFTGLSLTPRGATKDIAESRRRLQQQGLIRNDPDIYAGWVNAGMSRCIGKASILMKVVAMSNIVDDPGISEELFDYCVYSQIAHVEMGYDPVVKRRGIAYDALLSRFPRRRELESEMRRLNIHI